jgi:hypothetical protein
MAESTFVPADFAVPAELISPPFRLEPLGPQHNDADYAAWMSSIEHIRGTPGFIGRDWPDPEMSPEDNLADLHGHADDFARRAGFTYTVIEISSGEIIGCVYIYPPRGEDQDPPGAGDQHPAGGGEDDAAVSSWVRADRASLDAALYAAVSAWLAAAWPFRAVSYAPRQPAIP